MLERKRSEDVQEKLTRNLRFIRPHTNHEIWENKVRLVNIEKRSGANQLLSIATLKVNVTGAGIGTVNQRDVLVKIGLRDVQRP